MLLDFRDGGFEHKQWVNSVQIHSKKMLRFQANPSNLSKQDRFSYFPGKT